MKEKKMICPVCGQDLTSRIQEYMLIRSLKLHSQEEK